VEQVLLALATVMVLTLLAWVVAVLTLLWALRRANRVDARVRAPAPITWLWSPRQPARLHRRLRGAVRLARRSGNGPGGGTRHLVDELAGHAVALDRHLITAACCPASLRRARLADLAVRTATIEASAVRLTEVAASVAPPADGSALQHLAERIDHVAVAHAELRHLETVPFLTHRS
jgi:hypothetical protein